MNDANGGDDRFRPAEPGPIDPVAMARRDLKRSVPRRFYAEVAVGGVEGGWGILLDGKPVRTPAKAALSVPSEALATAIAEEWRAQGDLVDPESMPLTRLVNSALDGVAAAMDATVAEVAKYAETDLVCYRAADPESLVAAQARAWDPVLDFAREQLGARFFCAEGLIYVEQPEAAREAVRSAVAALAGGPAGPIRLAGLSVMTSLTGSVLIALAVARGVLAVETAWAAAHVDEDYQIAQWGEDEEAAERRRNRKRDMEAAALACRLA